MKDAKEIHQKISEIENRIRFMIAYMQVKIETKDWHGVEDAGSDIRDLEAEKKALLWVLEE
jgi:hypothetical protein